MTQQTQAFFTVLLAAIFLHEIPPLRHRLGMLVACAGLLLIGLTTGSDLQPAALGLALAAALSWAVGNILVKLSAGAPVFPLMVWCSLVAPLPMLLLSAVIDAQPSLLAAVTEASWRSIAVAIYLGTLATPVAYGLWSHLLQRYPAAVVAPFALLAPVTGILSSAVILGEVFAPMRYAGMALILIGLVVIVWPLRKTFAPPGAP